MTRRSFVTLFRRMMLSVSDDNRVLISAMVEMLETLDPDYLIVLRPARDYLGERNTYPEQEKDCLQSLSKAIGETLHALALQDYPINRKD